MEKCINCNDRKIHIKKNKLCTRCGGYFYKNKKMWNITVTRGESGSGTLRKDGYVYIQKKELIGHPNAYENGRMLEHVFIMTNHLGRTLMKGETVHHKNGIRNDNRIENLEIYVTSHPAGQRLEDKINWAIEFLKKYGYKVIL